MLFSFLCMTYVLKTWSYDTGHICSHSLVLSFTYMKSNIIEISLQLSCVLLNVLSVIYNDIFIWYSSASAWVHILIL